jgi:hypothetical protein
MTPVSSRSTWQGDFAHPTMPAVHFRSWHDTGITGPPALCPVWAACGIMFWKESKLSLLTKTSARY